MTLTEYLTKTKALLESRGDKPELPVTSIPSLNSRIWGFKKGQVTIIGARTSNGKSAFASQIAWDFVKQGKKVMFLSIEMTIERVLERLFSLEKRIDNFELQTGKFKFNQKYKDQWKEFEEFVLNSQLVVSDQIGSTWKEIDTLINNLESKPDLLFIDHIHHIKTGNSNDKQAIDEYLEHLREMTIRNKMSTILCAQINRVSQQENDGEPMIHHLKSTGKLEEIADIILLLWWPYHANKAKDKNEYKLNIAKNRDGMTGKLLLHFAPEFYQFKDGIEKQVYDKKTTNKGWQE